MTTAALTGFATETLTGPRGLKLHLDGNGKITASQGSLTDPVANAFSLPQVVTCPYRTPTCEAACYVHNLETHQGWLHDLYKENLASLRTVLGWMYNDKGAYEQVVSLLANAAAKHREFRWHVSGDLMDRDHARFVAAIVKRTHTIGNRNDFVTKHWIYTRSFPLVESFLDDLSFARDDISVNLSADKDNYWLARRTADQTGLRVCYLTTDALDANLEDLRDDDVIFPDYPLRGVDENGKQQPHSWREGSMLWQFLDGDHRRMVCPVDAYGKSDNNRCGPCDKCIRQPVVPIRVDA